MLIGVTIHFDTTLTNAIQLLALLTRSAMNGLSDCTTELSLLMSQYEVVRLLHILVMTFTVMGKRTHQSLEICVRKSLYLVIIGNDNWIGLDDSFNGGSDVLVSSVAARHRTSDDIDDEMSDDENEHEDERKDDQKQ